MKTIITLLVLLPLPLGVRGDTLHTVEFWDTEVHVQVVNTIDSSMVANSERVGNLYIDRISRTDSVLFWYCTETCDDDTTWSCMAFPIVHNIVVVQFLPDLNGDGVSDISDLMWHIDYMFER